LKDAEPAAEAVLPFADLLAELRALGLQVGLREHLSIGRLLERCDRLETGEMRAALAALLARNRAEVELVQQTFDRLYGASETAPPDVDPRETAQEDGPPPPSQNRYALGVVLFVLIFLAGALWISRGDPVKVVNESPKIGVSLPSQNWWLIGAVGAALAGGLLILLWRLGQWARPAFRSRGGPIRALPGPGGYDFVLRGLAEPFDSRRLDELSALLARSWASVGGRKSLDIRRSLERTLNAGLAPQLVWKAPRAHPPLLILEDVGEEMSPWHWRISALLDGLAARGVNLDRWSFRTDARLVFHTPEEPGVPLGRLAQIRSGHRLVVISTGLGLLEGEDDRVASWVEMLASWEDRVWLHPSPSTRAWRPALELAPVDVFSMDSAGLLAAADALARIERRGRKDSGSRIVSAADVEQLRWVVSLAPRRDPRLAERLRQEFCPDIPASALPETLAAPPPASKPADAIAEVEVHRFLLRVLDDSRPAEGTVAWERWRLDRAIQEAAIDPSTIGKLESLAEGPLRGALRQALARGPLARRLSQPQLRRLRARALRKPAKAPAQARLERPAGARQGLLKATTSWRTVSVMLMSFASGMPLGLVWIAIPDWMRDIGVDIRMVGLVTLTQLPWSFKFLWAPFMDRFVPFKLGRRRGWMIFAQVALLVSMLALAGVGSHPEVPWVVAAIALAIALAGATQDVAIDAYAVDVLRQEEQAVAVGGRTAFYRGGLYIAGGLAISLAGQFGWPAVNALLAFLYLPMILIVWKSPDPGMNTAAPRTIREAVWHPFLSFLARHRALGMLAFIPFYKLSDNLAQALQQPFLIDMGYSAPDRGVALSTIVLVTNLLGTLIGGLLTTPLGLVRSLWIFGLFQIVSNAGYALLAQQAGVNTRLMGIAVGYEALCSGLGSGALLVMLLRMTDKRFSAIQYALFSSLFGLTRIAAGPIAGFGAYALGWEMFFWWTLPFGIPGLILLARFAPWSAREIDFRAVPAKSREPLTGRQLAARGLVGGMAAFVLGLFLLASLGALRAMRDSSFATGFDLGTQLVNLLLPTSQSDRISLAGLLVLGAVCGLVIAALNAARHGAGQELGFDSESTPTSKGWPQSRPPESQS
jgi:PAT family beta-lactamase induction signal transducer AmpG